MHKCSIVKVDTYELETDLIPLNIQDFNMILGINGLFSHFAIVDCFHKEVTLRKLKKPDFISCGERDIILSCVIAAIVTKWFLWKGYQTYLAHTMDTRVGEPRIKEIPMAKDSLDVFPNDLPRAWPDKEFEFTVDLIPSTAPISLPFTKLLFSS